MSANRIRYYRELEGMTQAELALHLGVSQQAVQAWEAGTRDVKSSRIAQISSILGVSVSDLLGYVPVPSLGLRLTVGDEELPAALPAGAEKVVDVWAQLDPDMRSALEHAADMLLSIQRSRGRS